MCWKLAVQMAIMDKVPYPLDGNFTCLTARPEPAVPPTDQG